ncbi:hypothetical protein BTVI_43403 [Pitangus sulphuratus]|nr:hypothetical protein BTVI_43403 [Pitangus sulphuratus]
MNRLLKLQLCGLGDRSYKKWVDNLDKAVRVLNNHMMSPTLTPLILVKGLGLPPPGLRPEAGGYPDPMGSFMDCKGTLSLSWSSPQFQGVMAFESTPVSCGVPSHQRQSLMDLSSDMFPAIQSFPPPWSATTVFEEFKFPLDVRDNLLFVHLAICITMLYLIYEGRTKICRECVQKPSPEVDSFKWHGLWDDMEKLVVDHQALNEEVKNDHKKLRKEFKESIVHVSPVQTGAPAIQNRHPPARERRYATLVNLCFFLCEHEEDMSKRNGKPTYACGGFPPVGLGDPGRVIVKKGQTLKGLTGTLERALDRPAPGCQGAWVNFGKWIGCVSPLINWDFTLEQAFDPDEITRCLMEGHLSYKDPNLQLSVLCWGLAYRAAIGHSRKAKAETETQTMPPETNDTSIESTEIRVQMQLEVSAISTKSTERGTQTQLEASTASAKPVETGVRTMDLMDTRTQTMTVACAEETPPSNH